MGAYHTSITFHGFVFTFVANRGIVKFSSQRQENLPDGAEFQETITLGKSCVESAGHVNEIVNKLGAFFHATSYHLVHRNCNHFSETFATALILAPELVEGTAGRLNTFPVWVNRLANNSKMVVSHDEDIVPCNVLEEAKKAVGADRKVGWSLTSLSSDTKLKGDKKKQSTKKTLTEAQKAALAKIRKK